MVAFLGFKVALLATVGFATFGASLLPFFLAQKLAGRTAMAAVAAASACSAGVVVGAWLCHMMPDASESFAGYLEDVGADEGLADYPFAGVCCGGVIALLVAVDALIVRGGMDGEDHSHHGEHGGGDGGSHDHITDSFRKLIERADASAAHSLPAADAALAGRPAVGAGGHADGSAGLEGYQLHTSPPNLAPPPMRAVPSAAGPAPATAATALLLRSPSLGTSGQAASSGDASVLSGGSSAGGSAGSAGYGATSGSVLSRTIGSHAHSKGDSRRRGGTSGGGGTGGSHAGTHDDDAVVGVELQVEKRRVEHPTGDGPDGASPDSPGTADANGHKADDATQQLLLHAAPAGHVHPPPHSQHHDHDDHHHHHGHHHPSAAQRRKKLLRAWVFFIALSLHGVFDGLSVGAEDTTTGFSSTVIAVLSHKLFDGLSLGCALFPAGLPRLHRWLLLGICAATTPLGIGIGMAAEEAVGSAHAKLVTAIVLGLASGTFAYVSLMELLPSSLASPHLLRWKLLLFVAGFASMAAIAVAA